MFKRGMQITKPTTLDVNIMYVYIGGRLYIRCVYTSADISVCLHLIIKYSDAIYCAFRVKNRKEAGIGEVAALGVAVLAQSTRPYIDVSPHCTIEAVHAAACPKVLNPSAYTHTECCSCEKVGGTRAKGVAVVCGERCGK